MYAKSKIGASAKSHIKRISLYLSVVISILIAFFKYIKYIYRKVGDLGNQTFLPESVPG